MPEGPEIQIACDKLKRVLEGEVLTRVEIDWIPLRDFQERWVGLRVEQLEARGKALLTRFENGDILYSHNQLYGRWMTKRDGTHPISNRSLRLALITAKGGAFLYSSTDLEVLGLEEIPLHPYLSRLGPNILSPKLRPSQIVRRLQAKEFRNRQLASLYLDQSFLAGPGNYLRSEILFEAGLHPCPQTEPTGARPTQNSGQSHPRDWATSLRNQGLHSAGAIGGSVET